MDHVLMSALPPSLLSWFGSKEKILNLVVTAQRRQTLDYKDGQDQGWRRKGLRH